MTKYVLPIRMYSLFAGLLLRPPPAHENTEKGPWIPPGPSSISMIFHLGQQKEVSCPSWYYIRSSFIGLQISCDNSVKILYLCYQTWIFLHFSLCYRFQGPFNNILLPYWVLITIILFFPLSLSHFQGFWPLYYA